MAETTIEWTATQMPDGTTRPGFTFNPWIGCSKVHAGCTHCYAERDWDKRRGIAQWGPNGTRVVTSDANWRKPVAWNKAAAAAGVRAKVFCASLADVFEDWRGEMHSGGLDGGVMAIDNARTRLLTMDDVRRRLFELIDSTPWLDWLILTKRPENIRRMWPKYYIDEAEDCPEGYEREAFRQGKVLEQIPNVWLLTSVSDQASADKQIPELLKCRRCSPVLGISAEPLLGPIDLQRHLNGGKTQEEWHARAMSGIDPYGWRPDYPSLDWIICGGESGHGARPMHPDWARSLRNQCHAAGVAFHFKQWGEFGPMGEAEPNWRDVRVDLSGRDVTQCPGLWDETDALMVRVGKKAAGRMLDGRTWDEFPAVKAVSP